MFEVLALMKITLSAVSTWHEQGGVLQVIGWSSKSLLPSTCLPFDGIGPLTLAFLALFQQNQRNRDVRIAVTCTDSSKWAVSAPSTVRVIGCRTMHTVCEYLDSM